MDDNGIPPNSLFTSMFTFTVLEAAITYQLETVEGRGGKTVWVSISGLTIIHDVYTRR